MSAIRLIPIVLVATASLLVLKTTGILTGSGYTLRGLADGPAMTQSVAHTTNEPPEVTGAVGGSEKAQAAAEDAKVSTEAADKRADQPGPKADGVAIRPDDRPQIAAGERAVLERLQQRRQELEKRGRELDMREGLLKAAEKRLEERLAELRTLEAQLKAEEQKKDEIEAARFKGLVTMYESMKPKDAARIFDRLDLKVLLEMATQINPRRMSEILAQMAPAAAERLTIELAARASGRPRPVSVDQLPKIEGRPRS